MIKYNCSNTNRSLRTIYHPGMAAPGWFLFQQISDVDGQLWEDADGDIIRK